MTPPPKDPIKYQQYITNQRNSKLGQIAWNKGLFDNPKEWMKRFNSKYIITNTGCWEWKDHLHTISGYGTFWKNGKNILAHRFSYEFFNGIIPEKLTVDHLCKNKKCVNPYHLDLTTRIDNVRRGSNEIAHNKEKTSCPQGHLYDFKNTYFTKEGFRHCRKCRQIHKKNHRLRQKFKRSFV